MRRRNCFSDMIWTFFSTAVRCLRLVDTSLPSSKSPEATRSVVFPETLFATCSPPFKKKLIQYIMIYTPYNIAIGAMLFLFMILYSSTTQSSYLAAVLQHQPLDVISGHRVAHYSCAGDLVPLQTKRRTLRRHTPHFISLFTGNRYIRREHSFCRRR